MTERSADDIRRDIEKARVTLAGSVDQIVDRTNPKRLADDAKQSVIARARTPQGQAVLGAVGLVVVLLVVRRIRHRGA